MCSLPVSVSKELIPNGIWLSEKLIKSKDFSNQSGFYKKHKIKYDLSNIVPRAFLDFCWYKFSFSSLICHLIHTFKNKKMKYMYYIPPPQYFSIPLLVVISHEVGNKFERLEKCFFKHSICSKKRFLKVLQFPFFKM